MAPLPAPRSPSDTYLHDIATSLRVLSDRDDDQDIDDARRTVALREPVQGVDATPTPATSKDRKTVKAPEDAGGDPFDPSNHSVEEVNAYLADADDDERTRVLEAEAAGKDRKTVKAPEDA